VGGDNSQSSKWAASGLLLHGSLWCGMGPRTSSGGVSGGMLGMPGGGGGGGEAHGGLVCLGWTLVEGGLLLAGAFTAGTGDGDGLAAGGGAFTGLGLGGACREVGEGGGGGAKGGRGGGHGLQADRRLVHTIGIRAASRAW
jgi:hypothetical protein